MLDWLSRENHTFLNPRHSADQARVLLDLVAEFEAEFRSHLFLLTSGTTAQSVQDLKWVALSKEALLASAQAVNGHLQSHHSDVWLHTLPDFHVGGLGIWARSFLSQARVVQISGWKPQDFVEAIASHQVTLTSLVPAQIYDLVKEGLASPPSLRAVLVGGGALSFSLYQQALSLGWPLLPTYGMTETASQIATASLDSLQQRGAGEAPALVILPHCEVKQSSEGLLQIRGKSLLSAYFYRVEGRAVMRDPKTEGWFVSQDQGKVQDGRLEVLGRSSDFIKIGGESVELGRLRDLLERLRLQLDIGADVALIAFPDLRLGHVIHLVSDSSLTEEQALAVVSRFNSEVLAFEKIRKRHVLSELPRTALGKLKLLEINLALNAGASERS